MKAVSPLADAISMPELLQRAHDYVERIAAAVTAIKEAENDQAREQAWPAAMADEAIGAEIRRLTRSGQRQRRPERRRIRAAASETAGR